MKRSMPAIFINAGTGGSPQLEILNKHGPNGVAKEFAVAQMSNIPVVRGVEKQHRTISNSNFFKVKFKDLARLYEPMSLPK